MRTRIKRASGPDLCFKFGQIEVALRGAPALIVAGALACIVGALSFLLMSGRH
jgi:hypothetical protein